MRLESVIVVFVSVVTSLYPVATEQLTPINPDKLDPDAAHVCQDIDREAYTQRVSYKQYYRQATNTWCAAFPPRCTEYRIASRTAYKIETLYRERKRFFCCDGYKSILGHNYCVPKCDHDCYKEKEQGYCVTPGRCKCYPGFNGKNCESGCDGNFWGPNCTKTCNCGTHGSCDPTNGNCVCHIGYTGQDCSQMCKDSFGMHCIHPCVCENDAICDNVNGRCSCKPGFYGAYCHKKCEPSSIGEEGCEQACPCQNGGICDKVTKACICPAGVKGQYCTQSCDEYHWGVNCTNICECNYGKCNSVDGTCVCDHGYSGQGCQIKCQDGFYGACCELECTCQNGGQCFHNESSKMVECNCTKTGFHGDKCSIRDCPSNEYLVPGSTQTCQRCDCLSHEHTESCHPLTGSCSCYPGYKGRYCSEKCKMPFYGKDCAEECKCAHGDCDFQSGECTTCYPGYVGVNCDKPCPDRTWGLNCANRCTCQNDAICHVKSGYCECKPGYAGLDCEKHCEKGKYGHSCSNNCNCNEERSTCSPIDGQCLCKPGFEGKNCQNTCSTGKYGYFCASGCDCATEGTSSCDPKSGFCHCLGGWTGKRCDILCGKNNWGQNCINTCDCSGNGYCHGISGVCTCFDGYRGDNCELDSDGVVIVAQQKGDRPSDAASSTMPLIIGIVIPCVILLVILVLVVRYFMRKIKFLKEEKVQVRYDTNGTIPAQTTVLNRNVANGNAAIGLDNPMYVEDNARNERRYPHLSQRASAAPPLPYRSQSCDPCDDIDVEKLRVEMDTGTCRPTSSQYADIDDVEDRYTTLKSVPGASTAGTMGSGSDGFQFYTGKDQTEDEGRRSRSSSITSGASGGYSNKAYVDMNGATHLNSADQSTGAFSQPLYDNKEQSTNGTSLDHPDALSSTASANTDQNPTGSLVQQESRLYDFPKSTRLSPIHTPDQGFAESQGYANSNLDLLQENTDTNKRENPYDTPSTSPPVKHEIPNGYLTPTANGYLTPKNEVNTSDTFA